MQRVDIRFRKVLGEVMNKSTIIQCDPDVLSGTPVFVGTRVPVKNLFDYLAAGEPLSEFLEDFPSVTRDQAAAALREAEHCWELHAHSAR
jgi:uncharacterized protein (DUF433 family)